MIVLGLAGPARAGKDTIADYLVRTYGFVKFAFSDELYREVREAFALDRTIDDSDSAPDTPQGEHILRSVETKDTPHPALTLDQCSDPEFRKVGFEMIRKLYRDGSPAALIGDEGLALSPRQVLQWWGTEYRRAQDPQYWVTATNKWLHGFRNLTPYPERRPQYFVNTTCRFPNEQAYIHTFRDGNVWHIRRDGIAQVNAHVSETPLPVLKGERELWNNDSKERLFSGIDRLLNSDAKFVRVEPELPMRYIAPEEFTKHIEACPQHPQWDSYKTSAECTCPKNEIVHPDVFKAAVRGIVESEEEKMRAEAYAKGH